MVKCVITVATTIMKKGTMQMYISSFLIAIYLGPEDKNEREITDCQMYIGNHGLPDMW